MTPEQVKAARKALRLSVADFAATFGVQPQTVRRWEMAPHRSGHREPSAANAAAVLAMLEARGLGYVMEGGR